jgi:hypothetical protein
MIIPNIPANVNNLTNVKFLLIIPSLRNIEYKCQSVNLPGFSIPVVDQSSPSLTIQVPGTGINYNKLRVTFLVDETLDNYLDIYNWAFQIAEPLGALTSQYPKKSKDIFKTITLQVLSNKDNATLAFEFYNTFPVSLSDLVFDTTIDDIEYLTATVTFTFLYYQKQ